MADLHPFDDAIRLQYKGATTFTGSVSSAYANMVGPFGGITNAQLLNAAMQHPKRIGEPIALTVNFASPIADGAFDIDASAVRTNRSTQHWSINLTQNGEVAATATAVFAKRRETWSALEEQPPKNLPPPGQLPRQSLAGRPAWVHRYDMRFIRGAMPETFDGREIEDSSSVLWIRDDPPRPLCFMSLSAIADSFFPRIFVRRAVRTPIGTISLTTYFHADSAMLAEQGERPVIGVARALNFRNGFFEQRAEIWSDQGHILASSVQMVYFKD